MGDVDDAPRNAFSADDDGVPNYAALEEALGPRATKALRRVFVHGGGDGASAVVVVDACGTRARKRARAPDCAVVAAALRNSRAVGRGARAPLWLRGGYAQQTFLSRRVLSGYDGLAFLRYRASAAAGVVLRSGVELDTALVAHLPRGSLVGLASRGRGGDAKPDAAKTAKGKRRVRVLYPHDGWCSAASLLGEDAYTRRARDDNDAPPPPPPPVALRAVPNATAGGSFADFCKGRNGGLVTTG